MQHILNNLHYNKIFSRYGSRVLTNLGISILKLDISAKDTVRNPQLREDNVEAVTLFPPHCYDEILQTDVPIASKP